MTPGDGNGIYKDERMTKPGKRYDQRKPCNNCHGTGTVERSYKDNNGKWHTETKSCPVCKGTGERR